MFLVLTITNMVVCLRLLFLLIYSVQMTTSASTMVTCYRVWYTKCGLHAVCFCWIVFVDIWLNSTLLICSQASDMYRIFFTFFLLLKIRLPVLKAFFKLLSICRVVGTIVVTILPFVKSWQNASYHYYIKITSNNAYNACIQLNYWFLAEVTIALQSLAIVMICCLSISHLYCEFIVTKLLKLGSHSIH